MGARELAQILRDYEGTYDFQAFAGAVEANLRKSGRELKSMLSTVYMVRLVDEGGGGSWGGITVLMFC